MTMKILILMGEENNESGRLSAIAKSRCTLAVKLFQDRSSDDIMVLPTGSFGAHFNTSDTAHGRLITKYLVDQGVPRDRILTYTNSSNTLEDALSARKEVVDLDVEEIIVVTSDFHAQRVTYIFDRIFRDKSVEFHKSETSDHDVDASRIRKLKSQEVSKLEKLKREWVDVPLYVKLDSKAEFPGPIYDNASIEQKHYDNLSVVAISGIVAVFFYPYISRYLLATATPNPFPEWGPFFFSSVLIGAFFAVYWGLAHTARTARRVMRWIEVSFGQHGFSTSYPRQYFAQLRIGIPKTILRIHFSMLFIIGCLTLMMVIVQLVFVFFLWSNSELAGENSYSSII